MSKKYIIIGANGQLGKALQTKYPDAKAVDSDELDITNWQAIESFDWNGITHILNAAAYTNVDGAETPTGRVASWAVNASAVANLAQVASIIDATLVHISSDYVFDGTKSPHTETEPLSPISVYGASKAAGDIACVTTPKHYLIRTSWVIGDGNNFVRTMMGLADQDISPSVVNDQIGRLTFTPTIVEAIEHLITSDTYGTYNLSNDGVSASWADITREIFTQLGRNDLKVINTSTEAYYFEKENIAPRPLKSTLDLSKIKSTGFTPTDWKQELKTYIEKERN